MDSREQRGRTHSMRELAAQHKARRRRLHSDQLVFMALLCASNSRPERHAHASTQARTHAHRGTQRHTQAHRGTHRHTQAHTGTHRHTQAHSPLEHRAEGRARDGGQRAQHCAGQRTCKRKPERARGGGQTNETARAAQRGTMRLREAIRGHSGGGRSHMSYEMAAARERRVRAVAVAFER